MDYGFREIFCVLSRSVIVLGKPTLVYFMRKTQADKLLRKVKKDYNQISGEFSDTRSNPWYEFEIYKEMTDEGDRVLDLGCGNGRLFTSLRERDVKYVGVDVSEGLLREAAKKHKKAKFKVGSFNKIPYKRPYFDKVFCVASFHHIPSKEYRIKALKEIKRVLKKDGTVAISVWNLWQKRYRKFVFESLFRLNKYDFGDTFIPWSKSGVKRYYHAFTIYEMRSLLRDAGFYLVDEVYVNNKSGVVENFWQANNIVYIAKPMS
jgi:ubiquinone/menaquinone biosynthesis C-methylase UbiE